MFLIRKQFTLRFLMGTVMLLAILLAGGVTTTRLVRFSSRYRANAAKHAQLERQYRNFIASLDEQFLQMENSGTALLGYAYHQKLADYHHSLSQAFERTSRRPWEQAPRDVDEPSFEALRENFGPLLIQLAIDHRLKDLDLSDMGIGLDQMKALTSCTELRSLDLSRNPITNQELNHIIDLKKLWRLNLANTKITNAGLDALKRMPNLLDLNLANTRITDAGLDALKGITGLVDLNLHGTEVTKSGLDSLSLALPNCTINE